MLLLTRLMLHVLSCSIVWGAVGAVRIDGIPLQSPGVGEARSLFPRPSSLPQRRSNYRQDGTRAPAAGPLATCDDGSLAPPWPEALGWWRPPALGFTQFLDGAGRGPCRAGNLLNRDFPHMPTHGNGGHRKLPRK